MVFYVNWDDNGQGFLCSGWNCFFPCPYFTEDSYPTDFRWELVVERGIKANRQKIVVRKEPGPGFIGCMLMLLPPYLFTVPCFLWKANAISMTFIKKKNDHVVTL